MTKVIFRKFSDGSIIALFPELTDNKKYTVSSYMHVGQHSDADYQNVISQTKLATENEYQVLKNELESLGYELNVIKKSKINWK